MSPTEVTEILVGHIGVAAGRDVGPETLLVDDQVFDSMGLIELVVWVETRFGVSFEAEELEEAFRSIATLANEVAAKFDRQGRPS